MPYRLCFVKDKILHFTDDFKNCWGDDFDDAPYELNAGEPYEWIDEWSAEENKEHGHSHIKYIAFAGGYWIAEPKDNSSYSVEMINKKAVPWLYCDEAGALFAGATMTEAKRWLKKAGVLWGELHE